MNLVFTYYFGFSFKRLGVGAMRKHIGSKEKLVGLQIYDLSAFVFQKSTITSANYYEVHILIAFVTGWVNRFANAGDAAMEVAGNTALRVRETVL